MRQLLYGGIVFLALLTSVDAKAQNPIADSLKNEVQLSDSDSLTIELFIELTLSVQQTFPDSAIHYALLAKDTAEKTGDLYLLTNSYRNLGAAYIRSGQYSQALVAISKASDYVSKLPNENLLRAEILRSLGNIYFIQYQHDEALSFYTDALALFLEAQDSSSIARVYDNFANVYYETQKLDTALLFYNKALSITESRGDEFSSAKTYLNMGMLYEQMDSLGQAISYSEDALRIAEKYNAQVMMTYPLKVLSTVSKRLENYEAAINYAQQSLELADALGIIYEQKDAHANLANAYERTGDFEKAYFHYKEQKELNDSLLNENANERLAEMRARYETEKKEQEISALEIENELKQTRIIAISSALGFVLLSMIVGVFWFASRKRKEMLLLEKDKIIAESKKKLAEEELDNSRLREDNLQKELTNYALHIVEKNDFLEEVKSEMVELRTEIKNSEAIKHINKLGSKIYQNLMLNKDREEFDIQVEQACEGFFKNLEHKFPKLTTQERRLAALLRLDLSSKEISGIMNISPKSVDQSRYRLRKKLTLPKERNLSTFLNQI